MRVLPLVLSIWFVAGAQVQQPGPTDPELILRERYNLSVDDIARVRAGEPVAKLLTSTGRDRIAVVGAVRVDGDKSRLADWVRNIEHFRGAAELGVSRVVPSPPAVTAFADLSLDAKDLADLQRCRPDKCALRLPADVLARLQRDVRWGSPEAASDANALVRQMLAGYAEAYLRGGNDAVSAHGGGQAGRSFAADTRELLQEATVLPQVAPELAEYLERFPAATLAGADQTLYWSVVPAGSDAVVGLHHLVVFRRGPGETLIADKSIYSSRYFEAGILVISLSDSRDGRGYYVIAGSRIMSSRLSGVAAKVLRGQVERSALELVRMYLGWLRESLAVPAAGH